MAPPSQNNAGWGIAFIVGGLLAISANDVLIKQLSGDYPLHQMVFTRSAIGIVFSLMLVQWEGGWRILKTSRPGLHALRGALLVVSNLTYFTALAVLPLADTTALFFAAPLMITLLSIPILGEKVGVMRLTAVAIGFAGVVVMQRPWAGSDALDVNRIVLMLPLLAALTYALNQLLTRKLGVESKASALAVYVQGMFLISSAIFWLVAGDGRFSEGIEDGSLIFLLRAWVWPTDGDWVFFVALGVNSAIVGYCLSQAYRLADAATIAPFEYIGLPLAVFWGWVIFAELPVWEVWVGMVLILGSGLFVFLREQQKARRVARVQVNRRF